MIAHIFIAAPQVPTTVAAALKQDGMPLKQTILNWRKAYPEFKCDYDAAISFRNQRLGWTTASILQMVQVCVGAPFVSNEHDLPSASGPAMSPA
jgi:hypothetical protein